MPKPTAAANAAPMPEPTRRAFVKASGALGTITALAVPVVLLPKAEAAVADPVFAALDRQKLAETALVNEMEANAVRRVSSRHRMTPEMDAREGAACAAMLAAAAATIRTVPTTAAGMLAYIDMIDTPMGWAGSIIDRDDVDVILATFRAFVLKGAINV